MELLVISALFLSTFGAGAYVGHRVTRRTAWEDFLATRDRGHEREREEWHKEREKLTYAVRKSAEAANHWRGETRRLAAELANQAKAKAVGK